MASMRTTINIEDDAIVMIKSYAEEREISLGQAASDLIHRGAESLPRFETKGGWVVFDVPAGTPALTSDAVAAAEEADYLEEHRRAFSPRR